MDNAGDIVWEYMKEILLQVLGMAPVQLEFPVPDCELGACFNGAPSRRANTADSQSAPAV